jgi:hypothetical protein
MVNCSKFWKWARLVGSTATALCPIFNSHASPDYMIRIEGASGLQGQTLYFNGQTGPITSGDRTALLDALGLAPQTSVVPIAIEFDVVSSYVPPSAGQPSFTASNCYTITQLCFEYPTAIAAVRLFVGSLNVSTSTFDWLEFGGTGPGLQGARDSHDVRGVWAPTTPNTGTSPTVTGLDFDSGSVVQYSYGLNAANWSLRDPTCPVDMGCSSWNWQGAQSWTSLAQSPISLLSVSFSRVRTGTDPYVSIGFGIGYSNCSECGVALVSVTSLSPVPELPSGKFLAAGLAIGAMLRGGRRKVRMARPFRLNHTDA